MQYVKVPDDRTSDFGKDVLNKLSDETEASINMNQTQQNISVQHEDSITEMDVSRVLRAITLGFTYQEAIKLFRDPLARFEVIDIKDRTRNYKEFKRQKARIIGENGKTKRVLSELTEASIQVQGNRVGIIGDTSDAMKAREAVMKILNGSPHAHVYENLEKYKKQKNEQKLI